MAETFALKARTGRAFRLVQGAQLRVPNTFRSQVLDARAFMADDIDLTAFWASKAIRLSVPCKPAGNRCSGSVTDTCNQTDFTVGGGSPLGRISLYQAALNQGFHIRSEGRKRI